MNKRVALPLS